MPFKPGQSGNLTGAGKGRERNKKLASQLLGGSVQAAVRAINAALNSDDPAWAAKLVFEYCYGKPVQGLELSGIDGKDLPIQLIFPSYKPPEK